VLPVTFTIMQSDRRRDLWAWVMEQVAAARRRGADVRPQTSARGVGILDGLAGRTPYEARPGWALATPELHADLPLDAGRYVQRARGYDFTLVNGQVLVDHDGLTDERPGHVVSPGPG
jgi:hypothetical protein